jgi:predicted DNA binding CopG/RHH family protein
MTKSKTKKDAKPTMAEYLKQSRVNAYVGPVVKKELAKRAKAKHMPLSRYIAEVLRNTCFEG